MKGDLLPYWPAILRRDAAAAYLSLSTGTFDTAVAAGQLPKAIPLVGKLKGWRRTDLDAWITAQHDAATGSNTWDDA